MSHAILNHCRFQYRLRTILIAITVIAFGLGWWNLRVRPQRTAVRVLRLMGAHVMYQNKQTLPLIGAITWPEWLVDSLGVDFFYNVEQVVVSRYDDDRIPNYSHITDSGIKQISRLRGVEWVDIEHDELTDERFARLRDIKGVTSLRICSNSISDVGLSDVGQLQSLKILELHSSGVTDAGLAHFSDFTNLEHLNLSYTGISDDGLKHIGKLAALRSLDISNTAITDAGLQYLVGLPHLVELYIHTTNISDAGLKHICSMTELETLSLSNTTITDSGIMQLRKMKNLKKLYLPRNVTTASVVRLQESLPHCQIYK